MDQSLRTSTSSIGPRSLHRREPSLSHHQTTPISKHYSLNHQILSAFESNFDNKVYHVAYALGLQFVETALLEIPKHGYFYSRRHERERMQSALDAVRVSQLLLNDVEPNLATHPPNGTCASLAQHQRVQRLADLAMEQVQQASQDQQDAPNSEWYESQRAATEAKIRSFERESEWCEPLLVCSDSLTGIICPLNNEQLAAHVPEQAMDATELSRTNENRQGKLPPFALSGRVHSAPAWTSPDWNLEKNSSYMVSDIISPPSFQAALSTSSNTSFLAASQTPELVRHNTTDEELLEKALFLSGIEVSSVPSNGMNSMGGSERTEKRDNPDEGQGPPHHLQLKTLSQLYHEDFDSLLASGRVRIGFTNTYQGRVPESTNGCTVIAPLLCIHHFVERSDALPDVPLLDATIQQVIDLETPSILTKLREDLGLSAQAFLIPSDAHDHLIENGQLSQQQFVNVIGGNILDDSHLQVLVNALSEPSGGFRKLAATLFFHEHVVAILKIRQDHKSSWFDIIDSLPLKDTLMGVNESQSDFLNRMGLTTTAEEMSDAFVPLTARIRCIDSESLVACLRWYACSKFNDENKAYIDQYPWNENSCDFDPRVFQAFIWCETPQ